VNNKSFYQPVFLTVVILKPPDICPDFTDFFQHPNLFTKEF